MIQNVPVLVIYDDQLCGAGILLNHLLGYYTLIPKNGCWDTNKLDADRIEFEIYFTSIQYQSGIKGKQCQKTGHIQVFGYLE